MKTNLPDGDLTVETLDKTFGTNVIDDMFRSECRRAGIRVKDSVYNPIDNPRDRANFFEKCSFQIQNGYLIHEDLHVATDPYVWDGEKWLNWDDALDKFEGLEPEDQESDPEA